MQDYAPHSARVPPSMSDQTSHAHRIAHTTRQENSMTRNQPRGNKAPPRTKQPVMLPKLGTALNWVPPKQSSVTKLHPKKRTTPPQ
ncbi:hypothetical protein DIE06_13960 [Burkholderia sp. Bp8998]|nr:hypothetical protein DIE06_13960 [Burkholderia sp. Bp8998]